MTLESPVWIKGVLNSNFYEINMPTHLQEIMISILTLPVQSNCYTAGNLTCSEDLKLHERGFEWLESGVCSKGGSGLKFS